ncbi:MAG: hypothetical protein Q4E07_07490 [Eubacteriales bacterium]|nr:hypothetical protein [Eubacteriales bacterium]
MTLKRYNGKASIIMAAVFLIPALYVLNMPFADVQHALLSFIAYPTLMLIAGSVGGLLSAALGFVIIAISGAAGAGVAHSLPFTLFLLPFSIAWLICLNNNIDYSKTIIILLVTHILSTLALIGYFRFFNPEITPYSMAQAFIKTLDSRAEKDIVLYALTNTGILSLRAMPENVQIFNDAAGGVVFMPEAREELYSQLALRAEILLRTLPVAMLTGESVLTSFCGSTLALHIGRRYDKSIDKNSFQLPLTVPFSVWSLSPPLKKGMVVLFAFYVFSTFMSGPIYIAGQMMFAVLTTMLTIQGMSLITFWLSRFVKRFYIKLFLLFLLFTVLNRSVAWLGLLDLIFNFRMRIMPIYPNNDNFQNKEDII